MTISNPVNLNSPGFASMTSGGVWNGRTLIAGTGIAISNPDGTLGNPVISSTASTTDLHVAKFIVGKVANQGNNYNSIAAANAAVSAGDTIYLQDGIYNESFTAIDGVNYVAVSSGGANNGIVTINGKVTLPAATNGCVFDNITFQNSGSDYCITTSSACYATFNACSIIGLSSAINHAGTGGTMVFTGCQGNAGAISITMITQSAGVIHIINGDWSYNGFSGVGNAISGGTLKVWSPGYFNIATVMSGSSIMYLSNTNYATAGPMISMSGTAQAFVNNIYSNPGAAAALTIGAGCTATITNSAIDSSATDVFTGAGTLIYGGIVYLNSSGHNVTTETPKPLEVTQGGSAASTLTGVLTGNGTSAFTASAVTQHGVLVGGASNAVSSTAVGTTGQVLTGVTSGDPVWATPPSGTILGAARTTSNTPTSTSTSLASTGTTPTTANTTSLITLSYTPTSSSSILIFDFSCPIQTSAGNNTGFHLFAGTTLISSFLAGTGGTGTYNTSPATFRYYATSGTTSSTTYAIYWSTDGGTTYALQNSSSTAFFNGHSNIMFMVTEVKA